MATLSSGGAGLLPKLQLLSEDILSEAERSFILKAAHKRSIRTDGRGLLEPRTCQIKVRTVAKARSLATCVLGNGTKASCTVSAELSLPYPDRPSEGILSIQADYMHSAGTRSLGVADLQPLERALQKAIDVESLCVVPGLRVWIVRCHIIVIDDCGAIMDACSLAASASLLHFRRPEVSVIGEDVTVHAIEDRIPVPLSVHYTPISITFALLDNAENVPDAIGNDMEFPSQSNIDWIALLDPTDREELAADGGLFQVLLNAHREVCGLAESGPLLSRTVFTQLIDAAGDLREERGMVLENAVLSSPFL
jgi:exosome complex component RRP45